MKTNFLIGNIGCSLVLGLLLLFRPDGTFPEETDPESGVATPSSQSSSQETAGERNRRVQTVSENHDQPRGSPSEPLVFIPASHLRQTSETLDADLTLSNWICEKLEITGSEREAANHAVATAFDAIRRAETTAIEHVETPEGESFYRIPPVGTVREDALTYLKDKLLGSMERSKALTVFEMLRSEVWFAPSELVKEVGMMFEGDLVTMKVKMFPPDNPAVASTMSSRYTGPDSRLFQIYNARFNHLVDLEPLAVQMYAEVQEGNEGE